VDRTGHAIRSAELSPLGQQEAVVLGVVDRALDVVARKSPDHVHRWPPAQRDDLCAFVIQIAHRNQRAEIAWRRAIVSKTGVAHIGDVFAGQLSAELAPPFSKDCHSHSDLPISLGFPAFHTIGAAGAEWFQMPSRVIFRYGARSGYSATTARIEPHRIVTRNGVPHRKHPG